MSNPLNSIDSAGRRSAAGVFRALLGGLFVLVAAGATLVGAGTEPAAAQWSTTEAHYQGGSALRDHAVSPTGFQHILTLQHASGWSRGENFFFVDMTCCAGAGIANRDIYGEWYSYLRLATFSDGLIRGIGPIGGINWGAQARVVKFTPGFRLALGLPGFAFANIDYTFMVDRSAGLDGGGAPKDGNSHVVDFNWALPFSVGSAAFSLEGHGEWQSPRDVEGGDRAPYWILLQPQLRWDLGKSVSGNEGRIFVGTEFHVWLNKFGAADADEVIPQALAVLRF